MMMKKGVVCIGFEETVIKVRDEACVFRNIGAFHRHRTRRDRTDRVRAIVSNPCYKNRGMEKLKGYFLGVFCGLMKHERAQQAFL